MRDINLFSYYIGNKKIYKRKFFYAWVITILVFVMLLVATGINNYRIIRLKKEIKQLESFLESDEVKESLLKIEEKSNKYNVMKQYYDVLVEIDKSISNQDIINTSLLEKISSTLPKDVYFLVMNISIDKLQIQGYADSRISIAKLQNNLRKLDLFDEVVVLNINEEKELNRFLFTLKCTFKGSEN